MGDPTLGSFGVTGVLTDPRITFFRATTAFASNYDAALTNELTAISSQVQAFPLVAATKDAAAVVKLASGQYTVHVAGRGESGITLGEIYDADPPATGDTSARIVNLSALGQVAPGEPLIGGFVINGTRAVRLLIRAVGPGLASGGVNGPLADPVLALYRSRNQVATNDDWSTPTTASAASAEEITAAATGAGAFALAPGSKDAALLILLPPGVYTAHVTGANNTSGRALLELYEALSW